MQRPCGERLVREEHRVCGEGLREGMLQAKLESSCRAVNARLRSLDVTERAMGSHGMSVGPGP